MNQDQNNTGVILKDPTPVAWVAGVETGASAISVNPTADWRKYEPKGEWQTFIWTDANGTVFNKDTQACVSFSANDELEAFTNFMIRTEKIPADAKHWLESNGYIDENGNVNFSDRFTAKMSGTTRLGNSLEAVWQSIKNNGLVPEKDWKISEEELAAIKANPSGYWDIYYKEVPADVVAKGKVFANLFPLQYEWLSFSTRPLTDEQFREALTVAPIQIATAVCMPWNTSDVINGCGDGAAHGTMLSCVDSESIRHILDHYEPFDKQLAANYRLTWATRATLSFSVFPMTEKPITFDYVFLKNLKYGYSATDEVHKLQEALQILVSPATGKPYMKPGTFGMYWNVTKTAVAQFQTDHGIKDPDGQGVNFGPQTRGAMNAEIKKYNA